MAVVVVSILLTAILPMIILSTATRLQARRVDLATQAARGYIDGVRSGAINIIDAPPLDTKTPSLCPAPPATFPFISGSKTNANVSGLVIADLPIKLSCIRGVKVDSNNNGFDVTDPQDLVIHPMRSGEIPEITDPKTEGFYMQVRVYRADAFTTDTSGKLIGFQSGLTALKFTDVDCGSAKQIISGSNGRKDCPLVTAGADIYLSANTNIPLSQINSRIKKTVTPP